MTALSALIVKRRLPYPIDFGIDAVSYAILRAIAGVFSRITLVVLDDERARDGAGHLRELGIEVVPVRAGAGVGAQRSPVGAALRNGNLLLRGVPRLQQAESWPALEGALASLTSEQQYDVTQFDYWTLAPRRKAARGPAVLLNIDAWFRTVEGFARYDPSPIRRFFWRADAAATKRWELGAQRSFDRQLFLTEADRASMESAGGASGSSAVVPPSFPFEPVEPVARASRTVLFVGAMNQLFNSDAAVRFAQDIWPAVLRDVPDAQFVIAGREPTADVRALASRPGVRVAGLVPDLGPLFRGAATMVSPGRFGTGIRVKVAQSLAAGLPVVGTEPGLSGFAGAPGVVRADDDASFAREVVALLRDESHRRGLSEAGRAHYRDNLWVEQAAPLVAAFYEGLARSLREGGSATPRAADAVRA